MFGCLRKIITAFVFILALIGFFSIGGLTFFKDFIHNPFAQVQETKIQKAADIADFSKLNNEFELVSSSKLPKIGNYVYVKHAVSSQKFFMAKPSEKNQILTKKDFSSNAAQQKILDFVKDFKLFKLENFEITGRSSVNAMGQNIPYVKFKSDIVNVPMHGVEGIIGCAYKDGANIIIVAINSGGKYSQIITNVLLNELNADNAGILFAILIDILLE